MSAGMQNDNGETLLGPEGLRMQAKMPHLVISLDMRLIKSYDNFTQYLIIAGREHSAKLNVCEFVRIKYPNIRDNVHTLSISRKSRKKELLLCLIEMNELPVLISESAFQCIHFPRWAE